MNNMFQIENNILYCTEDYVKGKLSDNEEKIKKCTYTVLTDLQILKLENCLNNNISNLGHKCLSVYRDMFIGSSGDVYNVCLSCGDFYKNNQRYFLTSEGIDLFKTLKG